MMTTRRNFIRQATLLGLSTFIPKIRTYAKNQTKTKQQTLGRSGVKDGGVWDVIVVGGGPAGCTSAISAAREGAHTLLIEAGGQLGGMGTAGLVPTWSPFSDGEKIIYRGLAEKIFVESKKEFHT